MLPLVVTAIARESADVVSVRLADPGGAALPAWAPGAHLDVQLLTRQQRQYSLCGDPDDRRSYRIAVLREEWSRGASMYVHDHLRPGGTVHVRPPRNLFPLEPAPAHLLLAAGIGITPILPMAVALQRRGADWALHHAVRDGSRPAFGSELEALGDAVTVHGPGAAARLDLDALLAEPRPGLAVHCCGPARFTDAVEAAMRHWPRGALHLERFVPKARKTGPDAPFTVVCARSAVTVEVPADRTMLQALEAQGLPVVGSCLRGVCGSCAVRVLQGRVEHRDSLTADDDTGVVHACVSRAAGPALTVDL